MRKKSIFLLILFLTATVQTKVLAADSTDTIELNEYNLRSMLKETNPTIESINALIQQSVVNQKTFNRNYDFQVYGSGTYNKSNNDWTTYDFSGTNNETNFAIGARKQSVYGMSGEISFGDNNGNYHLYGQNDYDLNRSALSITYSIDLWKNFLGYQTLTNKLNLELNKKQSEINAYIEKNNFYYSMRRLYWQLVIKNKKLEFYKEMVNQAQKNLNIVQKKHKTYIADAGDLAKAKANLDLKKSDYNNAKVDIEQTIQQLKYYIPDLIDKKIIVNSFDLTDTFNEIKACNDGIYTGKTSQWRNLTTYNEYINLMDEIIENEIKIASREDDIDITLGLSANFRGVANERTDSYKDLKEFDRNDYSISLDVSKAIGFNGVEEDKIKLLKMNYNVNKNSTLANIGSIYASYENVMRNMFSNLDSLRKYKKNMEETVKNANYKYNQGRVSLTDLLDEQNNLINANIQLINMEGTIIDTLLQYLSIFDKTSCDFNLKF